MAKNIPLYEILINRLLEAVLESIQASKTYYISGNIHSQTAYQGLLACIYTAQRNTVGLFFSSV